MEIKNITEDTIDAAIQFSFDICLEATARSYPLFDSIEKLKSEYKRCINKKNRELLGCYSDNKLVGVLCFYYLPEDNYLQTTALYAEKGNPHVIALFLSYIESHYKHCDIIIGIEPTYEIAMSTLSQFAYQLVDNSIDFRLNMDEKMSINFPISESVKKIDASNFDQYLRFHKDNIDANAGYWTADRISEHKDKWDIYVIYENEMIVSAIYCTTHSNKLSEVFGAFSSSETQMEIMLEYAAIDLKNKYPALPCFMMMVDINDINSINAAIKAGFKQENRYCCWKKTT